MELSRLLPLHAGPSPDDVVEQRETLVYDFREDTSLECIGETLVVVRETPRHHGVLGTVLVGDWGDGAAGEAKGGRREE